MPDGDYSSLDGIGSHSTVQKTLDDRNQGKCGTLTGPPDDSPNADAGGRFELDPAKLRDVINKLIQERESIIQDGADLAHAGSTAQGPAPDVVSEGYGATLRFVLSEFQRHNKSMQAYSSANIDRLSASQDQYSSLDQYSTADLLDMVQLLGTTENA